MKAYYYCFLFWRKIRFFFQKLEIFAKNVFYDVKFFLKNFVSCEYIRSILTNEVSNESLLLQFLIWKKKSRYFSKIWIFCKTMYFFYVYLFWNFLFSANITFDFNKWGLQWNDRIPSICFSKKNRFFKFNYD